MKNMGQKLSPKKVDIVKMDPKGVQIVDNRNSGTSDNSLSLGKELVATVVLELAKGTAPVVIDFTKDFSKLGIEILKGMFEDKRDGRKAMIQKEFNILIQNIKKEYAKEDYNQSKIDSWNERIDKLKQELFEIRSKIWWFTKILSGEFNQIKYEVTIIILVILILFNGGDCSIRASAFCPNGEGLFNKWYESNGKIMEIRTGGMGYAYFFCNSIFLILAAVIMEFLSELRALENLRSGGGGDCSRRAIAFLVPLTKQFSKRRYVTMIGNKC